MHCNAFCKAGSFRVPTWSAVRGSSFAYWQFAFLIHTCMYRTDKTTVLTQKKDIFANYISGNVKPDIILFNPETGKYLIFDVKYKDSSNSRFSRSDRMQVLAYGLMYDAEHIGNIFPTQDGTSNHFYKSNAINSTEARERMYHQLEIAIDTNRSFSLQSKDGTQQVHLLEYLKRLVQ